MNKKLEKFNERLVHVAERIVYDVFKTETAALGLSELINFIVFEDSCLPMIMAEKTRESYDYTSLEEFIDRYSSIEEHIRTDIMTFMVWDYVKLLDDGRIIPSADILLPKSTLTRILIACDDDEKIMAAMRIYIRHELGHAIDEIKLIGDETNENAAAEKRNESCKLLNKHYKAYYKMLDKYNITDEKLKTKLYYMIPEEASANKNVGITFEDIWNADQMLK